jgi:hypothetical protein
MSFLKGNLKGKRRDFENCSGFGSKICNGDISCFQSGRELGEEAVSLDRKLGARIFPQMSSSTIQIYGRIRPLKKNSKLKYSSGRYWLGQDKELPTVGFHIPRDEQQVINHQKENYEYSFNKLFDVDATQDEIFDLVAKPVVSS